MDVGLLLPSMMVIENDSIILLLSLVYMSKQRGLIVGQERDKDTEGEGILLNDWMTSDKNWDHEPSTWALLELLGIVMKIVLLVIG